MLLLTYLLTYNPEQSFMKNMPKDVVPGKEVTLGVLKTMKTFLVLRV